MIKNPKYLTVISIERVEHDFDFLLVETWILGFNYPTLAYDSLLIPKQQQNHNHTTTHHANPNTPL